MDRRRSRFIRPMLRQMMYQILATAHVAQQHDPEDDAHSVRKSVGRDDDQKSLSDVTAQHQALATQLMADVGQVRDFSGQQQYDPNHVGNSLPPDYQTILSAVTERQRESTAMAAEYLADRQVPANSSAQQLDPDNVNFVGNFLSADYQKILSDVTEQQRENQAMAADFIARQVPDSFGHQHDPGDGDIVNRLLTTSLSFDPTAAASQNKGTNDPSPELIQPTLSQQEDLPLPADFMNLLSGSYNKIRQAFRFPGIRFNQRQLEYLLQRLLQPAIESALPRLLALYPQDRTRFSPILKEFVWLFKSIEYLVDCCTNRRWWLEALTKADGGCDFRLFSSELLKCISLVEVMCAQDQTESMQDDHLQIDELIGFAIEDEETVNQIRSREQASEPDVCDLDSRRVQVECEDLIYREGSTPAFIDKEKVPIARYLAARLAGSDRNLIRYEQQNPNSIFSIPDYLSIPPEDISWQKPLGQGAYGAVHEVHWLGNRFAAKLYQTADDRSFKQEAAILSTLDHPHVVKLWGCCIDRTLNTCTLLIDLMDRDLFDYVEARSAQGGSPPLSNLTSIRIMLQIAEGMAYLHSRGVMHRDLKAKNVLVAGFHPLPMLASDGYTWVKVCDFGMAKTKLTSSNFTSPHVGTSYWRAPEVFKDEAMHKRYTKKADVYSFAMTCAEILTAKPPFNQILNKDLYGLITAAGLRPTLPSSCPRYLAAYLQRCWATDPSHRPPFSEICRMLRHLKGLLIRSGSNQNWLFPGVRVTDLEEIAKNLGLDWCISECLRAKTVPTDMIIRFLLKASISNTFASTDSLKKALVGVGNVVANWKGSKHEFNKAKLMFEVGARAGHAEAQWKLGLLLELGLGTEKDEEEAVRLYLEEAAEQGHPNAYVELGRCFDWGRGVQLSDKMAAFYWERAIKHQINTNRSIQCMAELIDIVSHGSDEAICEIAAVRLWELSVRCRAGRTILAGPNNSNIAPLLAALAGEKTLDIAKHMTTLMLANLSSEKEMGSFILIGGGVAALLKFLNTRGIQNFRWRSGILGAFERLSEMDATAFTSEAVKCGLIPSLLSCLRHDPSLAGKLLIQCLQADEAKAWLSKHKNVVMAIFKVESTTPGVSSKDAKEMKQQLLALGFDM